MISSTFFLIFVMLVTPLVLSRRIVVVSLPHSGHYTVCFSVAKEIRNRFPKDDEVVFAVSKKLKNLVESVPGLVFYDFYTEEHLALLDEYRRFVNDQSKGDLEIPSESGMIRRFSEMRTKSMNMMQKVNELAFEKLYKDLNSTIDLLVLDSIMFDGMFFVARHDINMVALSTSLSNFRSSFGFPVWFSSDTVSEMTFLKSIQHKYYDIRMFATLLYVFYKGVGMKALGELASVMNGPVILPNIHGFDYNHGASNIKRVGFIVHEKPFDEKVDLLMKHWLDEQKKVLYISPGSASTFPEQLLKDFFLASKKLGFSVLLSMRDVIRSQYSDEFFENFDHVKIENWVNQYFVLGHENVKVFFSHAGSNSVVESIDRGCPIILFPKALDQVSISARVVERKIGLRILSSNEVDVEKIEWMLTELTENQIYRKNLLKFKRLSEIAGGAKEAARIVEEVITRGKDGMKKDYELFGRFKMIFTILRISLIVIMMLIGQIVLKAIFNRCFQRKKVVLKEKKL